MFALLLIIHVIISVILIMVVLLQSGKAGDLASTFGGATSQTAFGSRGAATVLTRATAVMAALFMLTSLGLAILYTQGDTSVMDRVPYPEDPATESAPINVPDEQDQPGVDETETTPPGDLESPEASPDNN